jgi:hypothetical protein
MSASAMSKTELIKTIKARIAAGDKAQDEADQHYKSAGLLLHRLKAQHRGTWAEWETLLKEKIGIGKSRASELIAIGRGRKTPEQVKSERRERQRIAAQRKS